MKHTQLQEKNTWIWLIYGWNFPFDPISDGTWLLAENIMLSKRLLAIHTQHSHLCRTCSKNIALVHWIGYSSAYEKRGCNLENTVHMVQTHCLFNGILYHLEADYALEKSSVYCRVLTLEEPLYFWEETAHEWTLFLCKQGTVHYLKSCNTL